MQVLPFSADLAFITIDVITRACEIGGFTMLAGSINTVLSEIYPLLIFCVALIMIAFSSRRSLSPQKKGLGLQSIIN